MMVVIKLQFNGSCYSKTIVSAQPFYHPMAIVSTVYSDRFMVALI